MNKNSVLHISMALLAILILALPPLIDSYHPALKFQPLITTMEGTPKEQKERVATMTHALQGNALVFLGASEVSTSEDEPNAVYNFYNKTLHRPVVAYGNIMIENLTQLSILSYYKNALSDKTKLVLLISPDSFFFDQVPPSVFAEHVPGRIFNKIAADNNLQPLLKNYLTHIKSEDISHLSFQAMKMRGWHWEDFKKEVSYQFASYCDLIRHYYLGFFSADTSLNTSWPVEAKTTAEPDWSALSEQAKNINVANHENASSHWMDPDYYHDHPKKEQWDNVPPTPAQVTAFKLMIKMLHERHVHVVVIVDPLNPWANDHSERFKPADNIITETLKSDNIPYFDMYDQPYQNGWNWDFIHPTDLAWVAMNKFIYENFK
ncbi:DltD [Enterobacteriaceae bacterium RIT691]|nr:DltD [Enterobacteriaceae bacterium RIT691]